jgi:type VI secretion system protein ImpA
VAKAGSREQAYRQLAQAAALLRQLEPHSPIPYLIQRAVELGSMPFPQLIRALIREQNVLSELNRELGIKEGETPPTG